MPLADEALLQQFKAGDARAFRALVERYAPALYRAAVRLVLDPMEAENVVQESFLRVVTSLDRIQLKKPFKPYVYRIAINLCYDYGRKKKPIPFAELDRAAKSSSEEPQSEMILDEAPAVWEYLEKEALAHQVNSAMQKLSASYRAVIVLRYFEEFSYEEIAQSLDIPLNTVRTHLRRAKQELRMHLGKENILSARNETDATPRVYLPGLQSAKGS
ncbi:MAG: RNA polymerase sigma factor [Chloroflexi bacterium]|nr:RNA polymerase sigma factor [Chloroflexota bacterium]